MINGKIDEVIEKVFQIAFGTSIKSSEFLFHCIHLLYYKCHKTNPIMVDDM